MEKVRISALPFERCVCARVARDSGVSRKKGKIPRIASLLAFLGVLLKRVKKHHDTFRTMGFHGLRRTAIQFIRDESDGETDLGTDALPRKFTPEQVREIRRLKR